MFYTDEEISVITGFLNGYLVRDHASAKVCSIESSCRRKFLHDTLFYR